MHSAFLRYFRVLSNRTMKFVSNRFITLCVVIISSVVIVTKVPLLSFNILKGADEKICSRNDSRPHILLIVADDLGFNDVGYHGSNIETPFIDKLALSGIRLENYYVQAVCSPTRAALLTGRYPIHTGVQRAIYYGQPLGMPSDHPTLAEKLREAGYSTHIVGKWHLGFHHRRYLPTERGFDSFFGFFNGHSDYFRHITKSRYFIGVDLMESDKPVNWSTYDGFYSTELFANKTIEIIRTHDLQKVKADELFKAVYGEHTTQPSNLVPLFMYLPFQAVHGPVQAPTDYIKQTGSSKKTVRDIYEGMVRCVDNCIGAVVDAMKKRGLWENTILVFFSDNGGPIGTGASNWPLKGHKGNGWEGGVRSVGFVHSNLLSDRVTGTVFKELMHVTDWFPTFLNLAKGTYDGSKPLDGVDQWHSLKYGTQSQRQEILHDILSADPPMQPFPNESMSLTRLRRASIRIGKWKFLKEFNTEDNAAEQFDETRKAYLHNIDEDPEEKNNLLEENPAMVQKLVQRLKFYWKGMVPCLNAERDPRSNPRFRRGFWEPWIE